MPNWCLNQVVVTDLEGSKKTKEKIDAVIHALNLCSINDSMEFFDAIIPRPKVRDDDWYEWNVANWGTKWGAKELYFKVSDDRDKVTITFDTAWSPPTPILDAIHDLGLDVQSKFEEHEGGYVGTYSNGVVDCREPVDKAQLPTEEWCSVANAKGYTDKEIMDFMEENNIEWATKGCIGGDDAHIELYNEVSGASLCKYPWDSSQSLIEALTFLMDMHKRNKDGSNDVNV